VTVEALLLLLGDQPLVRVETMQRLIEAWRDGAGPVVRPRYGDEPDTPGTRSSSTAWCGRCAAGPVETAGWPASCPRQPSST
jgi:CTP:molybdopterin cytidylyltransferase MocA